MRCRIVPSLIGQVVVVGMLLLGAVGTRAAEPSPDGVAFFESKIRPVLVAKCYQCHSAEAQAAGRLKAELLLDTRDGILKGGESGPAIVPGDKKKSLLLDAVAHQGLEMPPEGKLPENVIADFTAWFDMGAPDPRTGPAAAVESRKIDVAGSTSSATGRAAATSSTKTAGRSTSTVTS